MIISQALQQGADILGKNGVPDARREAASLMVYVLDRDRAFLIAHSDEELPPETVERFNTVISRRAGREPFQYIVGKQEFYGIDFEVVPGVLIPRPETETLVDAAIDYLSGLDSPRFLEIGVGSGCVSVSVLKHVQNSSAIGVDISEGALLLTERNAERAEVADCLELRLGSLYEPVGGLTFNAILSNPPYVSAAELEQLQSEVRDFEPHAALTDGGSGLSIIKRIIDLAPKYLPAGGSLILEFGFGQSSSVLTMFDQTVWSSVKIIKDRRMIDRVVISKLA